MASRQALIPIPKNRGVEPDDVNALYHILNGAYSNTRGSATETATRGLGMAVKLWGYDGRMPSGLINTTDYALDVRNRETTAQRAAAFRRADNKIVFEVRGGLPYGVVDTSALTSPTQVMVFDQPAGGVLGGAYPNPSFALASEYYRRYPKEIVAWYGSSATTLVGGNLELTAMPGWVLCLGQTVTMRDGSILTVPNMADRYPFGLGGTHATLGTTIGNSLAGQAAISIAHTHGQTDHTHQTASHTHTLGSHSHTTPAHAHSLNSHTHTVASHTHDLAHAHTLPDHGHGIGSHTHTLSHTHDLASHTHTDGSHNHGLSNHSHSMQAHTHSTSISLSTGGPSPVNGLATAGGVNLPQADHTHNVSGTFPSGGPSSGSTGTPSSNSTDTQTASSTGSPSNNTSGGASSTQTTSANPLTSLTTDGITSSPSIPLVGGPSGAAAPATGTPSPTTTSGADGNGTSGGSSASSDGSGALTTSAGTTSSVNTGTASVATINATPPSLGWWWVLKL